MLELTPDQRRFLRAQAHHLNPTVMIGNAGLTDAVMREMARSLDAHELIKVRVFSDERAQREAILAEICDQLGAAAVQHIGKLLVVYRPGAEPKILLPEIGKKKPPLAPPKPAAPPKKSPQMDTTGRPGGNKRRRISGH